MLEYLNKYKELLEQFENKKNEINNINISLTDTKTKLIAVEKDLNKLKNEEHALNYEYEIHMNEKIKKLRYRILLILCTIFVGLITLSLKICGIKGILLFFPFYIACGSIIYFINFIIENYSNVFERLFNKNKDVSKLLKQIKNNQIELSNAMQIWNKYRDEYNDLWAKSTKINQELTTIMRNINELKINYATPIFEQHINDSLSASNANTEEPKLVKKLTPQKK